MVIAALLMCFIVLIQNSKGGGLASGFSSSNAIMGVRKTTDFLEKATWGLAIFMVVMSIATAYVVPTSSAAKDAVWDALGAIDASFSASDINIDVKVSGLAAGASLTVATESSNLNIRQEPSTEAAVVGKAAKGEVVTLVEQSSDEWWKVKTAGGAEGYAYARYLKA